MLAPGPNFQLCSPKYHPALYQREGKTDISPQPVPEFSAAFHMLVNK